MLVAAAVIGLLGSFVPGASAVHLYRGPGGGCTPADGPTGDAATPAATIMVMHNTFNDAANALPITVINAGDSIAFTWNSSHCHSVQASAGEFYSGFHYPTAPPESPQAVAGVFEYPVPDLTPTLVWTHTFATPGVFQYSCEHHAAIGMVGVVIVQ
jgi:plastocyanin